MHAEAFDGVLNHTQSTVEPPVLVQRESRILLARLEGYHVTYRPSNLQYDLGKEGAIHVLVPAMLRDDQREARCVRVMGLIERLYPPHLAPSRPALRHLHNATLCPLEATCSCGSTHLLPLRVLTRRRRLSPIGAILRVQSALKLLSLLWGVRGVLPVQPHDPGSSFRALSTSPVREGEA